MALRIGTLTGALGAARGSCIAARLAQQQPALEPEVFPAATIAELREALRAGTIDLAVHAYEQIPPGRAEGLVLAAIPFRGEARDALAGRARGSLRSLPPQAVVTVGTELRRAQIAASCPHLDVRLSPCGTEALLAGLERGEATACVVSAAELRLLAFEGQARVLGLEEVLPAPAQGAIVLECRDADAETRALVAAIDSPGLRRAVTAERTFLAAATQASSYPAAAFAETFGTTLKLNALLAPPGRIVRSKMAGPLETAAGLGRALAQELATLAAQSTSA